MREFASLITDGDQTFVLNGDRRVLSCKTSDKAGVRMVRYLVDSANASPFGLDDGSLQILAREYTDNPGMMEQEIEPYDPVHVLNQNLHVAAFEIGKKLGYTFTWTEMAYAFLGVTLDYLMTARRDEGLEGFLELEEMLRMADEHFYSART